MNDDRNADFVQADEDVLLDQILARADDSVLVSVEMALEHDGGLARIFSLHPARARRRHRGERRRVAQDRPPQDAIADQPNGSRRP